MSVKNRPVYNLLTCVLLIIMSFSVSAKDSQLASQVSASIEKNVLLPNSQKALAAAKQLAALLKKLEQQPKQENLLQVQSQFIQLIKTWKKVEALYSAGNMSSNMIDTPRYIDTYHSGKENLNKQLSRAIKSTSKIEHALFKNSTKSIGALEYILFFNNNGNVFTITQKKAARRIKMAQHISQHLILKLRKIQQFYLEDSNTNKIFSTQGKKSIEDLVNVLIDSSYKLLTWRVAEPGGFSEKFSGKPSAQQLEYHLSGGTFYAIDAILQSFKAVLNNKNYLELGDYGAENGAAEKIHSVQRNINLAIAKNRRVIQIQLKNKLSSEQTVLTPEFKNLYRALFRLHNSFYILLIDSLELKGKIIEADGD